MDRMFIILLIWFAAIDDDVILDAMVWLTSVWCFVLWLLSLFVVLVKIYRF